MNALPLVDEAPMGPGARLRIVPRESEWICIRYVQSRICLPQHDYVPSRFPIDRTSLWVQRNRKYHQEESHYIGIREVYTKYQTMAYHSDTPTAPSINEDLLKNIPWWWRLVKASREFVICTISESVEFTSMGGGLEFGEIIIWRLTNKELTAKCCWLQ